VSGFFAFRGRFPLEKKLILRVETSLFLREEPTLLNNPGITVSTTHSRVHSTAQQWYREAVYGEEATYLGCIGRDIPTMV